MNLIKLCAVCSVLLVVAVGQETTIRIPLSSEEIDEVTFDASRESAADVGRWILLSEYGPYSEADYSVQPCAWAPPRESARTQEEIQLAHVTLGKLRNRISDLDEAHYPAELADVVSYLKKQRSFWLWLDSQELAFVETGDLGALQLPFDEIDPQNSCSAILERIRNAKDQKEAWHLACHDWHNCVLKAGYKRFGPYPKKAWQAFLAAYGIREQILSTEED
jgi:hypothetical protein